MPRPKVDSAVLRLTPLAKPLVPDALIGIFRRVVVGLFSFRRKQLAARTSGADRLLAGASPGALQEAGAGPDGSPGGARPGRLLLADAALVDGGWSPAARFVNLSHKLPMRKVADSTVRRLSLYLRFLEEFEGQGMATVSSEAPGASEAGTTSAQVRKDLSFFGSFGKRGLGYSGAGAGGAAAPDPWPGAAATGSRMIGAGKIGSALVQYRGFRQRGFDIVSIFDMRSRQDRHAVERPHGADDRPTSTATCRAQPVDMAVLVTPAGRGSGRDGPPGRVSASRRSCNFAPAQLSVPDDVVVKTVNLALELETLSYALTNQRDGVSGER